jgi:hypothetical protein
VTLCSTDGRCRRGYVLVFMRGVTVRVPQSMYTFWCSLSRVVSLLFLINSELKVFFWSLLLSGFRVAGSGPGAGSNITKFFARS